MNSGRLITFKATFLIQIFFCFYPLICQDTATINIDFGNAPSPFPWNNLSLPHTGQIDNLLTKQGFSTNLQITVYDAFNGINTNGTSMPDPSINIPATATGDSFFGNREFFNNAIEITGGIELSGLDTSINYDLFLFASRIASDNRETEYHIISSNQDTLYLQVSNNTNIWAQAKQLNPKPDGTIKIEATTGPNNNNTYGFFYLGALRLQFLVDSFSIPDRELNIVYPNGGEYWQPGKQPDIRWFSQGNPIVRLEYSIDEGENWVFIDSLSGNAQRYPWTIPGSASEDCLVRILSDTLIEQSDNLFTIAAEDTSDCQIVVLGSSTAAGAGPSVLDSAWVWRYRDNLFQKDTRFKVTNLARGGFTTYNILPTGTSIPSEINQSIDTAKNITKAITYNPDGIIINLPSNDAAFGYTVENQLYNYETILAPAYSDSIPVWICTPQPRNFDSINIQIQLELLDSTFARFNDFAIDFWNGFANSNNQIDIEYNSGDGIHLNDAGHFLLLQRVIEAQIDTFLLNNKDPIVSIPSLQEDNFGLTLFPVPAKDMLEIKYTLSKSEKVQLYLIDYTGKIIREIRNMNQPAGNYKLEVDLHGLTAGIYFLYLQTSKGKKATVHSLFINP